MHVWKEIACTAQDCSNQMDDLLAGASQALARCQVPARCYQVDEELLVTGICWEVEGLFTWLKKKQNNFL